MRPLISASLVCLLAQFGYSQAPPPQTARQALIEMFFGTAPNHLEKHLPDITRNTLKKLPSQNGMNALDEFSMIATQMKAGGGKLETFDTGPTLISGEDPRDGSKFELTVERDDLAGEEDQIELALHVIKNYKEESLPFIPRFTFVMTQQSDVWRLSEVDVTIKVPLADPAFLKAIEDQQREQSERMTMYAMQSIITSEKTYSVAQGGYACTLQALADSKGHNKYLWDPELASGKKDGYIFVISSCDSGHFKLVAEPETPNSGHRAFCTDEDGAIRSSADGKATSCLSSGEIVKEAQSGTVGLTATVPSASAASGNSQASIKQPAETGSAAQGPAAGSGGAPPQRIRLSSGVSQGLLVSQVKPAYPAEAKAARAQGAVVLHAIIGRDGSVQSLDVVSSASPLLEQAAMDAVRQWKYKPFLLNGAPVVVDTQITVNFTLAQPAAQSSH